MLIIVNAKTTNKQMNNTMFLCVLTCLIKVLDVFYLFEFVEFAECVEFVMFVFLSAYQ